MQETIHFRNPVKQVGFAQIEHVITLDQRISHGAFRLYCRYIYHAQQKDACWPGRDTLAEKMSVTPVTISRWNKELEDAGYITRQRRLNTSSITWIEDVEQNTELQGIARVELGCITSDTDTCIKNDTTHVSKMIPQSYQKCYVEEEQEEEEQKETAANAAETNVSVLVNSPLTKAADALTIVLVDNEYTIEPCPHCGGDVILKNLSRSAASCPHCQSGLWVKNADGEVICKPPSEYRTAKKSNNTLGLLFNDCPEKLKGTMYYARSREQLTAIHNQNAPLLWDCVNWAYRKMAAGQIPPNKIIESALSWAAKRLTAIPETEQQPAHAEKSTAEKLAEKYGITVEQLKEQLKQRGQNK